MARLSLDIDEETLEKIETAAKIEGVLLSRRVVSRLRNSMEQSWPPDYEWLFGAIDDESFRSPAQRDFDQDTPRERL